MNLVHRVRGVKASPTSISLLLSGAGKDLPLTLPSLWLWDHNPSSLHPSSMQRSLDHSAVPLEQTHVTSATSLPSGDGLAVLFSQDRTPVHFSAEFLATHAPGAVHTTQARSRYGLAPLELWTRAPQIPTVAAEDAIKDPRSVLKSLASVGAVILSSMPLTVDGTEKTLRRVVGPPRETFYGSMWDTAPKREVNDTAYTNLALEPHTDCTYLMDTPGLQCFNCVAQSDPGVATAGATHLVDAFAMVNYMRRDNPPAFSFFARTPLVFHHVEKGVNVRAVRRVIELDPYDDSTLVQFAYNMYDLAPVTYLSETQLREYYRHTRYLNQLIRATPFSTLRKLQIGDCLIVDNHRVMHGRTAFTGYRNLVGCYVGVDDWTARLRATDFE